MVAPALPRVPTWNKLIDKFENRWTPKRKFPATVLLGAESVLARMQHELLVSKQSAPLGLGEILAALAWTSAGQVNPLLSRKSDTQALGLAFHGGCAELSLAEREYDPSNAWACVDALDAVTWACVFVGLTDSDDVADEWVDPFKKFVRANASDLALFRSLYQAASWRLALRLRQGETFDEATRDIVADSAWWRDYEAKFRSGKAAWTDLRERVSPGRGRKREPSRPRLGRDKRRSRTRSDSRRKVGPRDHGAAACPTASR